MANAWRRSDLLFKLMAIYDKIMLKSYLADNGSELTRQTAVLSAACRMEWGLAIADGAAIH